MLNKLIKESVRNILSSNNLIDIFFNYYTNKTECKKNSFGWNYVVKKYGDNVIDDMIQIIMNEEGISEKSFKLVDDAIARAKSYILDNELSLMTIEKCYSESKRTNLCAEIIYSTFNKVNLQEKKKSKFEKLKDNKIPLTDEERKECFKQDAIWHNGYSKDPNTGREVKKVCAVWKSKNPKTGEITYITNTHRAYQTRKSLQAAINIYHSFIKGTS